MFQLFRFEQEASVLKGQLPSSRFFLKSDLYEFFKSITIFTLDVKILAASNRFRCVR